MAKEKKTIAIDFDGVLHSYMSGWTGHVPKDPPVEGAQNFVRELLSRNYEVVIVSTRAATKTGRRGIKEWFKNNGFPPIETTDKKVHAELYIDDRGFRFDGSFEKVLKQIRKMKPWGKK